VSTAVNSVDGIGIKAAPVSNRRNHIIFFAALLILLNALLDQSIASKPELLKVSDSIPKFELKLIGGAKVTDLDFVGKPTVYFFFADWCPCSHQSIGHIQKAERDYAPSGLAMVAIGTQDTSEQLTEFAKRYQIDFPVSAEGGNDVARIMGVKTTPTTIFVDKSGIVRSIFIGRIDEYSQLTDGLEDIVKKESTLASG
jgi:peroxiredoxin